MDLGSLHKILEKEPAYRYKQVKRAVFRDLISDWTEVTTLPLALRSSLNQKCSLGVEGKFFMAKGGETLKALITLKDGLKIESVLLRHRDGRNTVCVSCQVGCPLGCLFCSTGKLKFRRNLEAFEIVEQVLFFARLLKKEGRRITNVVFMGMGEPFLNYENVLAAIRTLNDKDGFNLGARHISVSTVGILEGIKKFAAEKLEVNLAISLHAPNDRLRSELILVNKKYPIRKILAAVDDYIDKTRRRVMFEYLMIKDLNDSDSCAEELAELMRGPLRFVNLILYNPTESFKPSSLARVQAFKKILKRRGIAVTERYRFGGDIKAACGQLVYRERNF